jgi:hypothetical protein
MTTEQQQQIRQSVEAIVHASHRLFADVSGVAVEWTSITSDHPQDMDRGIPKITPKVTVTFHKP